MKLPRFWRLLIILVLFGLACNIPVSSFSTPIVFPTPVTLNPGQSSSPEPLSSVPPTNTPAPPTATPRVWPPPYFGSPGPTPVTPIPDPALEINRDDNITFLLLGSDRRTTSTRTDVLIVVNFQPENDLVTMISIPRDLYVYIPGWTMQRINTAYQHGISSNYPGGGFGLIKDTILYNFGIHIDYVGLVDFHGFESIIDTLGGVDIPISCAFTDWRVIDPNGDLEDEDNWRLYTIGPGVVHLNGDLALWYARSRIKSSDLDRSRRQQEILRALYAQALRLNQIPQVPQLYNDFINSVDTDLGLEDILSLIPYAPQISTANIRSVYINTDVVVGWKSPQGASLLIPKYPDMLDRIQSAYEPPDEQESSNMGALVEVWNGTGQNGWRALAAERLNYGGFNTLDGIADRHNYSQTILVDLKGDNPTTAQELLKLIGIGAERLVYQPQLDSPADFRLILGADFQPCFNPAKIER